MKLLTVQSNHNKRPLKMRVAKEDIYTRACSIPTVRFEDQELTSFGGIVVFQQLFAKLNLKEHLRRCCAHLAEKNLYHPAVIVQWCNVSRSAVVTGHCPYHIISWRLIRG